MSKYYSNPLRIISFITLIAFVSTQVAWGYPECRDLSGKSSGSRSITQKIRYIRDDGRTLSKSPQKSQLRVRQFSEGANSTGAQNIKITESKLPTFVDKFKLIKPIFNMAFILLALGQGLKVLCWDLLLKTKGIEVYPLIEPWLFIQPSLHTSDAPLLIPFLIGKHIYPSLNLGFIMLSLSLLLIYVYKFYMSQEGIFAPWVSFARYVLKPMIAINIAAVLSDIIDVLRVGNGIDWLAIKGIGGINLEDLLIFPMVLIGAPISLINVWVAYRKVNRLIAVEEEYIDERRSGKSGDGYADKAGPVSQPKPNLPPVDSGVKGEAPTAGDVTGIANMAGKAQGVAERHNKLLAAAVLIRVAQQARNAAQIAQALAIEKDMLANKISEYVIDAAPVLKERFKDRNLSEALLTQNV